MQVRRSNTSSKVGALCTHCCSAAHQVQHNFNIAAANRAFTTWVRRSNTSSKVGAPALLHTRIWQLLDQPGLEGRCSAAKRTVLGSTPSAAQPQHCNTKQQLLHLLVCWMCYAADCACALCVIHRIVAV
jgi:hypothetical protein